MMRPPPYPRTRWVLWISTFLFLGGLFVVTRDASRSSVSAEPLVPLNYNHPLEYDSNLGMYGQSDHVGLSYPFSAEAEAQPVPSPLVAASLQELAEEENLLPVPKQLVHGSPESRDANASMTVDSKNNLWVAYTSFRQQQEEVYVRRRAMGVRDPVEYPSVGGFQSEAEHRTQRLAVGGLEPSAGGRRMVDNGTSL